MISNRQMALLHAAKRKLGLDDYAWRAVLKVHGDVDSATELNAAGFDRVVSYLRAQGFAKLAPAGGGDRPRLGVRPGFASPGQAEMIASLWRQYSGGDDDRALGYWLERTAKASNVRFLTAGQAQKAITGLQKMVARKAETKTATEMPPSTAAQDRR
jgi:hypothetical protein